MLDQRHSELVEKFAAICKPMSQWRPSFGAEALSPLGYFNCPSGTILISTFISKKCQKCENNMPLTICNACGKNQYNAVKVNAGLGSGDLGLWGFGKNGNLPLFADFLHIPFDQCLDPGNSNFGKNFLDYPAVPVVVAKFDADSFYRNYPTVFVGDKNFALDGANFFSSSRVALGMDHNILPPDVEANIYVIAWIGRLHDPATHFFMDQANHHSGFSMPESYGASTGELGVVACSVVPEGALVDFLPIYNAHESEIREFSKLATETREFALLNGAYIAGTDVPMLISNMSTSDAREELADINEKIWANYDQGYWYIGSSWKNQLRFSKAKDYDFSSYFEAAKKEGGASSLIAVADSLRIRGLAETSTAFVGRIEIDYANSLNDREKMLLKAMASTPPGCLMGDLF